jgi:uncharacterized protein
VSRLIAALAIGLSVLATSSARAARLDLPRPAEREFIIDHAGLLSPAQTRALRQRCSQLLADTGRPLGVVTVRRMADHGGRGMTLEFFARQLMHQWSDKHPLLDGPDWRDGILLLVAVDDQQARVEWGQPPSAEVDAISRLLLQERVLPAFRRGNGAHGIIAAVAGLDALARGQSPAAVYGSAQTLLAWIVTVTVALASVVSLIRRGPAGWASRLWAGLLRSPAAVLDLCTADTPPHAPADDGLPLPHGGAAAGW